MKAIVQDTYGPAEVLELRDVDQPPIADDAVLLRVRAAGVDRGVWHLMTGLPYPIRLAGYGLRAPKTPVPGMDVAGVVQAVGRDVTRFQPGDEVFGIGKGSADSGGRRNITTLPPNVVPAEGPWWLALAVVCSVLPRLRGGGEDV